MFLAIQQPKFALSKSYLKQRPLRSDIERFKEKLSLLLSKVDEIEREENQKNHIRDFLKETYYKDKYEINPKDNKDLVINLGYSSKANVGVIIETKRPGNIAEMITVEKPNAKALWELILYYFDERIRCNNFELKNLIITNVYEWYIFDANVFDKHFYQNSKFRKLYDNYVNEKKNTPFFFDEVRKLLDEFPRGEIHCTRFALRDYKPPFMFIEEEEEKKLIALYKILSPGHLLKVPFADDSNKLNSAFYKELLYIIGLEEVKEQNKNIIRRKQQNRHPGALIENIIGNIEVKDILSRIPDINQFGETYDEQIFNVALELSITWINRILFLKLLEGQLVNYHNGEKKYRFLNTAIIKDYSELFNLFHQVLAKTNDTRSEINKEKYSHIPYLNSSLFELGELEKQTLTISELTNSIPLELMNGTVLAEERKRSVSLHSLDYLFKFLDAFDFSSEGTEEILETNRTIINASVLGKVFEKINGYKDGSIFTPGFITMYMCRESIRKAVIQKFKEKYGWNIEQFNDIKNYIVDHKATKDILEFNSLVNSLRICDPAVGSGHFLVSALNEIIVIKHELGILADKDGTRIWDFEFEVESDELIITFSYDKIFEYKIVNGKPAKKEMKRLQKTLFHEKETIIENCLFGVDINPNSVKICQLRLWIELLKNAYYKEPNYTELETLPNIDINIKQGNSLISKFGTSDVFKIADKNIFERYKLAVSAYKTATDKTAKQQLKDLINNIKNQFSGLLSHPSSEEIKLTELAQKLHALNTEQGMLDSQKAIEKREHEKQKIISEIEKLRLKVEESQKNDIYRNAFEWRFEFPEVLNEEGEFVGFDIVIGNPPYIQLQKMNKEIDAFENQGYQTFIRTSDIYTLFFEKGYQILKYNGDICFITSNKWMRAGYGELLRDFFIKNTSPRKLIDFGGYKVFDEATVDSSILITQKINNSESTPFYACSIGRDFTDDSLIMSYFNSHRQIISNLTKNPWIISSNIEKQIKRKLESIGIPLKDWDVNIYRGILTGLNEAFIVDSETKNELIDEDPGSEEVIKPILRGRDIKKYKADFADLWLILFPKGFTIMNIREERKFLISEPTPRYGYEDFDEAWDFIKRHYRAIAEHLIKFKEKAEKRLDQGDYWWELRACAYYNEFEKEKICFSKASQEQAFAIDNNSSFMLNTSYSLTCEDNMNFLLSILNSKIAKFGFLNFYQSGGIFGEITIQGILDLPIPKIASELQLPFILLAKKIILKKEKNEDTSKEENQIDLMVYKLYELTYDEIKIVDLEFDSVLEQFGLSAAGYEKMGIEELGDIKVKG